MPETPKLRPYAVAMLFGDGAAFNLGQGIIGAPSKEMAAGQCVLDYTRQSGCTMPLMIVHVTEIDDASVRLMFNCMVGQRPGEVVPMKVVEGGDMHPFAMGRPFDAPPLVSENEQRARDAQDYPRGPPPPLGGAA